MFIVSLQLLASIPDGPVVPFRQREADLFVEVSIENRILQDAQSDYLLVTLDNSFTVRGHLVTLDNGFSVRGHLGHLE